MTPSGTRTESAAVGRSAMAVSMETDALENVGGLCRTAGWREGRLSARRGRPLDKMLDLYTTVEFLHLINPANATRTARHVEVRCGRAYR